MGTPPAMGLLLSKTASGRMYSTSSPLACFQLVMQAPGGGGRGGAGEDVAVVGRQRHAGQPAGAAAEGSGS